MDEWIICDRWDCNKDARYEFPDGGNDSIYLCEEHGEAHKDEEGVITLIKR